MLKTFAEDLKAVREDKNLSLRTISQQTRVSISILDNLENGDYTFQPQAYIRAFLKQYIISLGLDPEDVLFDYDLARSGKYKSKRQNVYNDVPAVKEINKNSEENNPKTNDKIKESTEALEKNAGEKETEKMHHSENAKTQVSHIKKDNVVRKTENNNTIQPGGKDSTAYNSRGIKKNKFSFTFISSPVARNIVLLGFIILVLLGLYSVINILFLEKSSDSPEVIRQNFDDVVKEQEKKILGKRSPQEIQDSIRKAQEESVFSTQSNKLKITGLRAGTIFLVTDSVNYDKPEKIQFAKNEVKEFNAKKSFHISSSNTDDFDAVLNDKLIKFGKVSISKVKLDKNGVKK